MMVLLLFRIYYRMAFARNLERHARIPRSRNLLNVGLIALGVMVLGAWYLKTAR